MTQSDNTSAVQTIAQTMLREQDYTVQQYIIRVKLIWAQDGPDPAHIPLRHGVSFGWLLAKRHMLIVCKIFICKLSNKCSKITSTILPSILNLVD